MAMESFVQDENRERRLSKEIVDVLERIDFDELKNIYDEELTRSGVDIKGREAEVLNTARFIGKEDFIALPFRDILRGAETTDLNENIAISPLVGIQAHFYKPLNHIRKMMNLKPLSLERDILAIVCHEEAHAVTDNILNWQSGYGEGSLFDLFDEGATDMIGEEKYKEYLNRRSLTSRAGGGEIRTDYPKTYLEGRKVVELFCERVAEACEVAPGTVWEAVKKGHFNSLRLRGEETRELLEEIFSPYALEKLAQATPDTNNSALLKRLEPGQTKKIATWWEKMLDKLPG